MFGHLPSSTTAVGHHSSASALSAMSTTISPSPSGHPILLGQSAAAQSSSVIVPPAPLSHHHPLLHPITIHSQHQMPAISAICLEQQQQPMHLHANNDNGGGQQSSACAASSLASLLAASLASLSQQQQHSQQQRHQTLSILGNPSPPQQQIIPSQSNLFSELLLLRSQQSANTPQPQSTTMPLPFPNGSNLLGIGQPPTLDQQQHQADCQSLLNAVQQQKTAIDIIQKALEAIAVVNQQQQPKMAGGTPSPPLMATNFQQEQQQPNGLPASLYVHLQQNGVPLGQQQQIPASAFLQQQQQQSNRQSLEQSLLALLSFHNQTAPIQSGGSGILNGTTPTTLFPTSATASALHPPPSHQSTNPMSAISAAAAGELPLDLSQRAMLFERTTSSSSSASIHSAGLPQQQQRRNCEVRRSASSISYMNSRNNAAEVNKHFQRSLSGKWPRTSVRAHLHPVASGGRVSKSGAIGMGGGGGGAIVVGKEGSIGETVIEGEAEGRDSPMDEGRASTDSTTTKMAAAVVAAAEQERPPSRPKSRLQHRLGYTLIKKIFTSDDKQVEEHFRKSLGDDRFKQIRNAQQKQQQESNNNVDKMDTNSARP